MKCPRDGTELQKVVVMDVELDKCHKCDGIWCDRGEMEKLRDSRTADIEEIIEEEYGNPEFVESPEKVEAKCPRCGGRLRNYNYSYIAPVVIDSCAKCFGVWLDDGELNKIVGQKKTLDEKYSKGKMEKLLNFLNSLVKNHDREKGR